MGQRPPCAMLSQSFLQTSPVLYTETEPGEEFSLAAPVGMAGRKQISYDLFIIHLCLFCIRQFHLLSFTALI